MKPKYMLAVVAIVAVLSISMMLINYVQVTGAIGKSGTPSFSILQDIDKCVDRNIEKGSPDDVREYCECIVLYSGYNTCKKYIGLSEQ